MITPQKIDIGKHGIEMAVVAAYIFEHADVHKPSGIDEPYKIMAHRVGLSPYKLKIALQKLHDMGLIHCIKFSSKSAPIIKLNLQLDGTQRLTPAT